MIEAITLPPLRQDLELIPDTASVEDVPGFLIRDVVLNRYIQISHDACKILSHWRAGLNLVDFIAHLEKAGISTTQADVVAFLTFLQQNDLIIRNHLRSDRPQQSKFKSLFDTALHNYLFFRIPLVYPDAFLKRTHRWTDVFAHPWFWIATAFVLLINLLFIGTRWDMAVAQISAQSGLSLSLKFAAAFIVSKSIHELAHAYVASRKGCVVGSLGIGFILGMPVFYADVTDSWRLSDRKDRLQVASAGLIAEFCVAIYAMAIWIINPISDFSSVFLYLALAIWISSLAINANPLIRFDGYHILCDLLGEKNFQDRSFASAREIIRWIMGFAQKPVIHHWRYPVYGFAAMVYRVIVVTGIAWFLYNFSFRLLGLALFAVEIWYFLLRPILNEAHRLKRDQVQFQATGRGLHLRLGACALLVLILIVPFSDQVAAPAIATREKSVRLYTRDGSLALEALSEKRRQLQDGETILALSDPARQSQLNETRLSVSILERRRAAITLVDTDRSRALALEAEIAKEKSRLTSLTENLNALSPRALFAGEFIPLEAIEAGRWLPARAPLGDLVAGKTRFIGFISERELARVPSSGTVTFIRDHDSHHIHGRLVLVNSAAEAHVPFPELATVYGGWIEARTSNNQLIADHAIYRIEALAEEGEPQVDMRAMGTLLIRSESRSLLSRFATSLLSILRRELRLA